MDKLHHSQKEDEWYHKERLFLVVLRVVASLVLLGSGILLLALRIPGWGIMFGLPLVIFGSVFIIYTYDEVLSKRIIAHDFSETKDDLKESKE